jgi:alkanesulfonate monooxygenase SsuD/methylene tetrahydromethanopterin reductase-like flavin-dependent oxidoreductase (luciferase family)
VKIGIVLPQAQREDGSHPRYRELRDFAQRADSTGLDAIWVFDHLFFRFPDEPTAGIWEAWTTLAAVCEATQRVEVGSIVLCTEFRNPAVLAKMADTADEISGGRLILGLGAGWHEPEFEAFGIPTDHRYGRFEESLTIISGLSGTAASTSRAGSTPRATASSSRVARDRAARPSSSRRGDRRCSV